MYSEPAERTQIALRPLFASADFPVESMSALKPVLPGAATDKVNHLQLVPCDHLNALPGGSRRDLAVMLDRHAVRLQLHQLNHPCQRHRPRELLKLALLSVDDEAKSHKD
jgi:hypothetical protein